MVFWLFLFNLKPAPMFTHTPPPDPYPLLLPAGVSCLVSPPSSLLLPAGAPRPPPDAVHAVRDGGAADRLWGRRPRSHRRLLHGALGHSPHRFSEPPTLLGILRLLDVFNFVVCSPLFFLGNVFLAFLSLCLGGCACCFLNIPFLSV